MSDTSFQVGETTVQIRDGDPTLDLPLVVLLHGMGGSQDHFTDPATSVGFNFNHEVAVPPQVGRGRHWYPNAGVWSVEIDPRISVTGWQTVLGAAGFPTLFYDQLDSWGLITPASEQLYKILTDPQFPQDFAARRLVFLAHSRGGLLVRKFLVDHAAALRNRVLAAVTLHSPHQGSELANQGIALNNILMGLRVTLASYSVPRIEVLDYIQSQVNHPAYQELRVGSPFLAALAANEPVAGVKFYTFGGTSTRVTRVRNNVFTPSSAVPDPLQPPPFHWTTVPMQLLSLLDGVPGLASVATEVRPGEGDLLVAAARAHLPFSTAASNNPLNHVEALWDRGLQMQVIDILRGLVAKPLRKMSTRLDPSKITLKKNPPRPRVPQTARGSFTGTVIAQDTATNAPVVGDVYKKGIKIGRTNTPFTEAFESFYNEDLDIWSQDPVTVTSSGYSGAAVSYQQEVVD